MKKAVEGTKRGGEKGLGKCFVGRAASGVADLTSISFKLIKKWIKKNLFKRDKIFLHF